ncbi:MAG TPA: bifunctional [glutamate--ammonia ligase]-adenylyl-L-tyrosine phosphorylase/[glutamate--ammonia-ligase] adenylyltransferase [Burkholderiaceae bacterium]|nr:bifunctional [glutamate--ammonia ligase]-adenylyl-L-tyrosine phosphorylase/[glutamate--ammonia-ligase] adenylyltransferase [Burkholderiaceae bacterium]
MTSSVRQEPAGTSPGARRALALSRFAQRALDAELGPQAEAVVREQWLDSLAAAPWDEARVLAAVAGHMVLRPADSQVERLSRALRRVRRHVILATMARDLDGRADLQEVMRTMTALAEVAVREAVAALAPALAQRYGTPHSAAGVPQDLLVVAMGKGGGYELNVSSDLDLVFVYDEDGQTVTGPAGGSTLTNHEFFERLGKQLIALLGEVTADGFVFRIDMRLRPNGDSGPLAVSTEMLEEYLIGLGREWERFAWLKGRVISAPVFATAEQFAQQMRALDAVVHPFVYRKYLDFGAIAALRELHAMIRAETGRKSARRQGGHDHHENNVKLGRGGIREIEFIAQTFQIIRGGRDRRLTSRMTLRTLAVLRELGLLASDTCTRLAAGYEFLRRLEHALQYVDDAQTHLLPADAAERERLAQMLRLPDAAALTAQFEETREFVAATFDAVFVDPSASVFGTARAQADTLEAIADTELLTERLAELGFAAPAEAADRVRALLSARRVVASEASRRAVQRLLGRAIEAVAAVAHEAAQRAAATRLADCSADELLARFVRLLDVIAGRTTYLALLAQYPQAFARVLRLLASSRWATDYLVRHPILLDELLDDRLTDLDNAKPVDWSAWRADVESHLTTLHGDTEREMNLVRDEHHAQVFRLLLADLDGRLTVERLADHLSLLADTVVDIVLHVVWRSLPRRHRETPLFSVIAYGKLGGKELGYASDLDLIFLYDDEHADAAEIYALFARRLIIWLTTRTSSGILFDVDLRLRPDGDAGLIVSSRAAFERYQRNENGHGAWTWEHQALTRARFCAGDARLGAAFEDLRNEVLARPRDLDRLRIDVLDMRRRMLDGHPNRSNLFDLKHDRGGMVDIEFIVQFLVLAHAGRHPRLLGNLGNIALLKIAGELGLIDLPLATRVADAYRDFRRVQHRLRLNVEPEQAAGARVPPEELAAQANAVRTLWRAVFATDAPERGAVSSPRPHQRERGRG